MEHRTSDRPCHRPLRLAACLGLATAMLGGTLAVPARAENHPNGRGNAAHHEVARQQDGNRGSWHEDHRRFDRGGGPDVYYGAPPVVYVPQGYYTQPGVSLNLEFPLIR